MFNKMIFRVVLYSTLCTFCVYAAKYREYRIQFIEDFLRQRRVRINSTLKPTKAIKNRIAQSGTQPTLIQKEFGSKHYRFRIK